MVGDRRGDVGGGSHHPGNFSNKSRRNRRRKNAAPPPSEKKCDESTSQSNNFGVSRKRFTPSTPGSNAQACPQLSSASCHPLSAELISTSSKQSENKLDNCNCRGQLPGFTIIDVRFCEITNVYVSRHL